MRTSNNLHWIDGSLFLDSKIFLNSVDNNLAVALFVTFSIIFIAFDNLFFKTQSVLEVIFWSELLLVTSIFGMSSVSFVCGFSIGNIYGIFLLLATAAEAAVGMLVVLESGNCGVSQNFYVTNK